MRTIIAMPERAGEQISVEPNGRVTFGVRYEDEHVLVVDKPARVVTTPGVGHQHDTLLNGLMARDPRTLARLGQRRDYGLCHRLDRDTSGLIAVARTAEAYGGLTAAFRERRVKKFYYAVCHKPPKDGSGVIRRAIEERVERVDKYTSKKTSVLSSGGKPAVTAFRVLATADTGMALVEARPVTGRLHQVRVHLASVGAAIVGDSEYGPRSAANAAKRVALHAHRLAFEHPVTGEAVDVRSPIPKDMRVIIRRVGLPLPSEIEAAPAGPGSEGGHELGGDAVGEEQA